MTQEEIIQAISDDKMMPFIQPEQLAGIVDFVIKNYKPSLPSDLDEAAEEYSRKKAVKYYGNTFYAFKAGAEWMAGQGVNIRGRVLPGPHCNSYVESDWFDMGYGGLSWNDEIIVQIRKKQ